MAPLFESSPNNCARALVRTLLCILAARSAWAASDLSAVSQQPLLRREASRLVLQSTESEPLYCSQAEIDKVLSAGANAQSVVVGMMSTNMPCVMCMIGCKSHPMPDSLRCLFGCQHQNENRCDESTGKSRVVPLLASASLADRGSLIRILEVLEADCVFCVLETIESVCGAACLLEHLHLALDYPVIQQRACFPELATSLALAQAKDFRMAVEKRQPFGFLVESAMEFSDVYVPTVEATVWRGVNLGYYFFRCDDATWAISESNDDAARGRCEGTMWLDVETAQARTDRTEASMKAGVGFLFTFGMESCGNVLSSEQTRLAHTRVRRSEQDGEDAQESVTFDEAASALDVACFLLWRVGVHSPVRTSTVTTVQIPPGIGPIELLADISVREGESLMLASDTSEPSTLVIGARQVRVRRTGKLTLASIRITESVSSSALYNEGATVVSDSAFSRCNASTTTVTRYGATLVPAGSESHPPVAGALLGSRGAAVRSSWNDASFRASGVVFEENRAEGAAIANWYVRRAPRHATPALVGRRVLALAVPGNYKQGAINPRCVHSCFGALTPHNLVLVQGWCAIRGRRNFGIGRCCHAPECGHRRYWLHLRRSRLHCFHDVQHHAVRVHRKRGAITCSRVRIFFDAGGYGCCGRCTLHTKR